MTEAQYAALLDEPETYVRLCNGIGPNGWARVIPDYTFRKAADFHDISYLMGGDENDRIIADEQFRSNCLHSIKLAERQEQSELYMATIAYYTVLTRLGHLYFNYRKRRLTFDELLEIGRTAKDEEDAKRLAASWPD